MVLIPKKEHSESQRDIVPFIKRFPYIPARKQKIYQYISVLLRVYLQVLWTHPSIHPLIHPSIHPHIHTYIHTDVHPTFMNVGFNSSQITLPKANHSSQEFGGDKRSQLQAVFLARVEWEQTHCCCFCLRGMTPTRIGQIQPKRGGVRWHTGPPQDRFSLSSISRKQNERRRRRLALYTCTAKKG